MLKVLGVAMAAAVLSGCCMTSYSPCAQRTVMLSSVTGAFAGGVIGHAASGVSTLEGAAVGAVAGALVGSVAADSLCSAPGYGQTFCLPPAYKTPDLPPPASSAGYGSGSSSRTTREK